MAMTFEVNGDNVWIADSNKEQLDNCPKEWKKSHTDVRDERAVKKLFENIKNDWETIDVLCANAGIKGPTALIEDISLTEWKECIEVNIDGIFLFCKQVQYFRFHFCNPRQDYLIRFLVHQMIYQYIGLIFYFLFQQ